MMNSQQLWQAALGELELLLSKANFTTWFRSTFISSYDNGRVIISVPNTFTMAWLEKKYHPKILKALRNVTDDAVKEVYYKVDTGRPNDSFTPPAPVADPIIPQTQPGDVNLNKPQEPRIAPLPSISTNQPATTGPDLDNSNPNSTLNPRYTFDTFVVGKSNELARAACMAAAAKPGQVYNPLFVYGGVGLGKTHLMQAVGNDILSQFGDKKVLYVSSEKFTNDFIASIKSGQVEKFKEKYRSVSVLLVDDIQFFASKPETQEQFFHTFNELHQLNRQIVLSADRPPKALQGVEQRLVSRFSMGLIADISSPDLETRIAILETKVKDRGFNFNQETLQYIAENVQSNIRDLEGALNQINAYCQLHNCAPNLEQIKQLLRSVSTTTTRKSLNARQIIVVVSEYFGVTIDDIIGKCRKKNLAVPRQIIMYLLREEIKYSYPNIGQEIGGRDHTTAIHAYLKITNEIQKDERMKQDVTSIKELLYA